MTEEIRKKIEQAAKEACRKYDETPDITLSHKEYSLSGLMIYHEAAEYGYSLSQEEIEDLKKEVERLKELFTEFVIRVNYFFPVTEEQLKWFGEGTDCKKDHILKFMLEVTEALGLTGIDDSEDTKTVRFPFGK